MRSGVFDLFPKDKNRETEVTASVSLCLERFLLLSSRPFSPLSSRLSVSAWRDLINAPLGASGKPQRSLDCARDDKEGARHDKGVGDLSTTLEMTRRGLEMTGGAREKPK